ncbi:hypothetical protein pdam_00002662 [Pocillopora damicornis]|uniref:G-protein coupled receptors family 1 profile domain-containing protein n=1 Tax=Pocillopora damicornis TaxID=46731 RepID=A0A3M6U2V7_POCDA|nr:hypothetical protein pdam_00002662 [Pocillopora damicornis]
MTSKLSLELTTREEALVWTETVLFAVTNVVAILGNLLIICAVYHNHRLRTIPNIFVIALAVSDILMSTICMPFTVASLFHGRWIFDETVCRFQAFDIFAFGKCSLGTMAAIAVSRYFCVVNREKYPSLFKKQRALIYIFIVWCLALVGSVPILVFKNDSIEFHPGKAMCLFKFESNIVYSASILCCFITTPLIIITICYVKVFRAVSRSNRVFSLENNPELLRVNVEEAQVTKRLVAVVVGFACCWLPVFVVDNIDMARGEPTLPRQVYLTNSLIIYLSSTINPFIYCAADKRFRREYKVVLRKIFTFKCRDNSENVNNPELLRMKVEETKVTKRLVAVVVGFACCWLPIFIIDNIDMAHREPTLPRPAYLTYSFLLYLSSPINPFIYCATDKRFRREYKAVFWKIFSFKCQANNENNDA